MRNENLLQSLTERDYERLSAILFQFHGFRLSHYKRALVMKALSRRMERLQLSGFEPYVKRLRQDQTEVSLLISGLTIKVSRFFRDQSLFEFMRQDLLPKLLREVMDRRVRILCVGIGYGEEPFSLAILLKEMGMQDRVALSGFDVDEEAIQRAKEGLYRSSQLAEVSPKARVQYFTKCEDLWKIDPQIVKMVNLMRGDIFENPEVPKSDLVLCRNLLIYFGRAQQQALMRYLRSIIVESGFLVLGKSEVLLGERKDGFRTYRARERVYQRL